MLTLHRGRPSVPRSHFELVHHVLHLELVPLALKWVENIRYSHTKTVQELLLYTWIHAHMQFMEIKCLSTSKVRQFFFFRNVELLRL